MSFSFSLSLSFLFPLPSLSLSFWRHYMRACVFCHSRFPEIWFIQFNNSPTLGISHILTSTTSPRPSSGISVIFIPPISRSMLFIPTTWNYVSSYRLHNIISVVFFLFQASENDLPHQLESNCLELIIYDTRTLIPELGNVNNAVDRCE